MARGVPLWKQGSVAMMIFNETCSGTQEQALTKFDPDDESRVCKGNYIGIVRPNENQYEFLVRDIRGEDPTIHGSGVDFLHASTAVAQLMDALTGQP
jgi:hypothetical protein